ncbi:GGDEF domain-containing protein [Desulfofundulus thermocisternus]|uniref:GGDEF domain-containing protein n=1 Tax=Desulfofundulus thermocisternus TaxID=42471 RepID=UPI00217E56E5|nr:GGDEF domain-containing protein [Desulfofundulus thermocisternus]MCS5695665.1 GGDEF domain-containing protein [Desulfofundulus thermocisternus]
MTTVENIMNRRIITASPFDSVRKAAEMMNEFKVGCLPVIESGQLAGIITSRDIRCSHPNRLVIDAMSKDLITVTPSCSIWDAAEIVERYKIERLVVAEDGKLLGIVTKLELYHELGKHFDTLTGLNKAEYLYYITGKLIRNNIALSIVFIDLDGFGEVDKKYGHIIGDEVLYRVANIIKAHVDEKLDYPCRYAGDEFAVVTVRPASTVEEYALKIVNAIASYNWDGGMKITASAGVVNCQPAIKSDCDIREFVNIASLASTKAKKKGVPVFTVFYNKE